jgi:hypothetical protein
MIRKLAVLLLECSPGTGFAQKPRWKRAEGSPSPDERMFCSRRALTPLFASRLAETGEREARHPDEEARREGLSPLIASA